MNKRILTVLLAALLVLVFAAASAESLRGYSRADGYQYVTFGSFEQTAASEIRPLLWRVVKAEDGIAYLCSEKILLAHRVHGAQKEYLTFGGDFKKTELWAWLNNDFLNHAFTEKERAALADPDGLGYVTLLSSAELKDKTLGFGTDNARKAWGTDYAIKVTDVFVYRRTFGSHSPYWTRDPVGKNGYKYGWRCIKQSGSIGYINVITLNEGVRPVCWVDENRVTVNGGTGTAADPLVLIPAES